MELSSPRSATQEIPQHFMEPKDSLPCSQQPPTGSHPDPHPPILLPIRVGLPSVLFPSGLPTFRDFSVLQFVLHAAPISASLIWQSYQYLDWMAGVRFSAGARILSSLSRRDRLWGTPSLLSNGYRGKSGRGVKLTAHLHLVLRTRMVELCLRSPICPHGVELN
jgi:hypothetical protein